MVVVVVVVLVVVLVLLIIAGSSAGIAGNCWYFAGILLVFAGPLLRYRFRYRFRYRCQVVLLTRD